MPRGLGISHQEQYSVNGKMFNNLAYVYSFETGSCLNTPVTFTIQEVVGVSPVELAMSSWHYLRIHHNNSTTTTTTHEIMSRSLDGHYLI